MRNPRDFALAALASETIDLQHIKTVSAFLSFFFLHCHSSTQQQSRHHKTPTRLPCLAITRKLILASLCLGQKKKDILLTLTLSSDLVMCRKQSGIAIGRLCDKCDGKCPVCDSYVRPTTLVRICDECSFGNYQNKCVVCGGEGISDAFYCYECTRLEKDRDGCPKIINLGSSRTDVCFSTFLVALSKQFMHILTFPLKYSYSIKRKPIGKQIISQAVARVWAGQ